LLAGLSFGHRFSFIRFGFNASVPIAI